MTRPRIARQLLVLVLALDLVVAVVAPAASGQTNPDPMRAERNRLSQLLAARNSASAESLANAMLERLALASQADSLAVADAYFGLAEALDQQRRWQDDSFSRSMRRALEIRTRHLGANHPDVGMASMRLAEMVGMGGDTACVDLARRALEIFQSQTAPNDTLVANCWIDLGQCELMAGSFDAAREAVGNGLALRQQVFGPVHRKVASAWMILGEVEMARGNFDPARDALEASLHVYDTLLGPDDLMRGGPISRLVELHMEEGDLARAIDFAHENLRLSRVSGDSTEVFISFCNLGNMLQRFEDFEGACRVLEAAEALEDHVGPASQSLRGIYRQVYGVASLNVGETERAMRLYTEGDSILAAHPNPGNEAIRALCILGQAEVLHRRGEHREALATCDRGIRLHDASAHPNLFSLVSSRAKRIRILEALGDTAAIEATRDELIGLRDREDLDLASIAPAHSYWIARAEQRTRGFEDAWREALRADDEARELLRLNLVALPESQALGLGLRMHYIQSQVVELADAMRPERWDIAWDRVVRQRGMVRTELARRRFPVRLRSDPDLVAIHTQWVHAQRALARRIVEGVRSRDPQETEALDRLRTRAERAEAEWARTLRARDVEAVPAEVGLAEVRGRLGAADALVSFVEIEDYDRELHVVAFVARGDSPLLARIELGPSAVLRGPLERWRALLSRPPRANLTAGRVEERACREAGEEVRHLVWDPIVARLEGLTQIALVSDGPLLDLPWHALPVGTEGYLVEEPLHLRLLDAERELLDAPGPRASGTLLALGDPDFSGIRARIAHDEDPIDRAHRASDPCSGELPRELAQLPGTALEAREVARTWTADDGQTATVLLGAEATESAFRERAPGSAVVHLATHGIVTGSGCGYAARGMRGVGGFSPIDAPAQPQSSVWLGRRVWLALAADAVDIPGEFAEDGLLTAEEVITLDLTGTDWVILSACHSDLAQSWTGEGALGMRRAFHLAGAASVFASRWAVEDEVTAEWMRRLYESRAAGDLRASAALASTCRAVLDDRRGAGLSTHPFYWAAFIVSGE